MPSDDQMAYPTGYEDAVIGTAERFCEAARRWETFLVLDFEKAVEVTQELLDCDRDGALDYLYYNVIGSNMGEAYFSAGELNQILEEDV